MAVTDGESDVSAAEETHALFIRATLMLSLMVGSMLLLNVLKMRGFHAISETTIFVLIGLFVGVAYVVTRYFLSDGKTHEGTDIQLSANFFYFVLLPPIIFEGGFTLQRVAFVRNLWPILALALAGGVFSTVVTSLVMYLFSRLIYPAFTLTHALVFGSIISSTDPVSVLGMLPPSTDRNLYMLIFGESALNDAVSIILYRFFTSLAESEKEQDGITVGKFCMSILQSVWIFVGSATIGIVVALMFAKLTKHVKAPEAAPIFELLMFLVFAYCSYLITDILGFTGIIGIFFCGVAMAHYAYDNLSKVTLLAAKVVLRTFSSMCDAFVFLYLGLGLVAFGKAKTTYNPAFIIVAIIAILLARTHVFIIGAANNFFSKVSHNVHRRIPMNHQIFLWFCGLRGAVAFALSVTLLSNKAFPDDISALIYGTTTMVVFFTVVLLGGFVPYVMRRLKLDAASQAEAAAALQRLQQQPPPPQSSASSTKQQKGVDSTMAPETPIFKSAKTGHQQPGGHKVQSSLTTLDEYLGPEQDSQNRAAAESAEDAAAFMDVIDSGFWIKIYEWDKRYLKPFFSVDPRRTKRQGNVVYDTAAVRSNVARGGHISSSMERVSNSNENVYEIRNTNLVSQLDDDDDDDELDRVSIAVAAEMIGIAGSTAYGYVQTQPSATGSHAPSMPAAIPPHMRSRTPSMSSLQQQQPLSQARRKDSSSKRSLIEMQPIRPPGDASTSTPSPSIPSARIGGGGAVRTDATTIPMAEEDEEAEGKPQQLQQPFEISFGRGGFGVGSSLRNPPSSGALSAGSKGVQQSQQTVRDSDTNSVAYSEFQSGGGVRDEDDGNADVQSVFNADDDDDGRKLVGAMARTARS